MTFLNRFERLKEGNRLEFKLAKGGFPKSFWETYSAFANTAGGVIILGIEETLSGLQMIGVQHADTLIQDLWNGLNNPQKVSANLLVDSDISIENEEDADFVVVKVPRADRLQRPVYINNSMNAGSFRRNGEGDYHCTMEAVRSMVRDSFDGAIDRDALNEIGLDALDSGSVRRYRNEFRSVRLNHPWIDLTDEEFLIRLGAIARSNEDSALHPTKAGLLMFGEAWRIVDAFPSYFLDCRRISGARRWDDRITSDSGDWSGNVYDFWNKACLMLCEGLPRPFELGPGMSRIDDTPQHKAVREGLTNALVHADYYGRTGVVVIRRNSTVEFSNPGNLRLPAEVVEGGGVSDPRNKTLMTMFNLIGKGDKAGSGFDVFRDAARYARVAEPELEEFLDPDRTKLTLHVETDGSKLVDAGGRSSVVDAVYLAEDNVVSDFGNDGVSPAENVGQNQTNVGKTEDNVGNLETNVGQNQTNVGQTNVGENAKSLNGVKIATAKKAGEAEKASKLDGRIMRSERTEKAVLACIAENRKITAEEIASQTGLSGRQVERSIKRLRESGRIERIGGSRGYWKIND